jgi:hypothetical protein
MNSGGQENAANVGQKIMAAVMNIPVSVMRTAGEGGAWGIALLASYMLHKERKNLWKPFFPTKSLQETGVSVRRYRRADGTLSWPD